MIVSSKRKHHEAVLWNPPTVHPFENDQTIVISEAMIRTHRGTFPGYVLRTQSQQQPILPGSWLIRMNGGITIMDQHTFDLSFETITILDGEIIETP